MHGQTNIKQEKPHPTPRAKYGWPRKPPLVLPNLGEFIDTTDAKQALVVETLTVIFYVRTRKRHTKGKTHGAWPYSNKRLSRYLTAGK